MRWEMIRASNIRLGLEPRTTGSWVQAIWHWPMKHQEVFVTYTCNKPNGHQRSCLSLSCNYSSHGISFAAALEVESPWFGAPVWIPPSTLIPLTWWNELSTHYFYYSYTSLTPESFKIKIHLCFIYKELNHPGFAKVYTVKVHPEKAINYIENTKD